MLKLAYIFSVEAVLQLMDKWHHR